jgi:hypothetical protein
MRCRRRRVSQTGTVDMVADISRALAATTWPAEEEAGARCFALRSPHSLRAQGPPKRRVSF